MKSLVLYAAAHPKGSSATIVQELKGLLHGPFEAVNLAGLPSPRSLPPYDVLLLITATYGDAELLDAVEYFLTHPDLDVRDKSYSVCELGNYYGYDDFTFGAKAVAEFQLQRKQAREFCPGASVDSLPRIDWHAIKSWCQRINSKTTAA